MANEFKIKNGFFSEGSSNITGSLTVTEGITGSLQGTASFATTASVNTNGNPLIGGSITSGQVAFGTGSGVIGGDAGLTWDNVNKRLGIGTSTPENPLVVRSPNTLGIELINILNSKSWKVNINSNDFFITETAVGNPFIIKAGGNVLINSTTNAGFRLDVNGTARFGATTVRAPGALSTDIAFRVRNSADTLDIIRAQGDGNVFVGLGAGNVNTGANNTANGSNALRNNTTGASNTANGANALQSNTTGANNTANGAQALRNNTTGASNTVIGASALRNNTTGGNNTANGVSALFSNTTGANNTANGSEALFNNTTGGSNTANGLSALFNNTTGGSNTANGVNAGRFIADGITANTITNNSVFIGADTRALADNQTNQIVIGFGAIGLGSNTAVLGNDSITLTRLKGNVAIGADTAGVRLDVRAQGALSTDVAFRVRNSANTADLLNVAGNGAITGSRINLYTDFASQPRAELGASNVVSSYGISSILGNSNTINLQSGGRANVIGSSNTVSGGSLSVNVIGSGNSGAGSGLVMIGSNNSNHIEKENTVIIGSRIKMPSAGARPYQIKIGTGGNVSTSDIQGSFQLYLNNTDNSDLFLSNKTNLVLSNQTFIAGGTHFEANATNTVTTHNGVAPTTNILDAFQLYSADRGGTAGKASAHFRAEDGTINVIGDSSGFGTDSPQARLDVRAQGALSTDVAFRVRNSADTGNIASITGNGVLNLAYLANASRIAINATTSGEAAVAIGSGNSGLRTVSVGYNNDAAGQNGVVIGQGNTAAQAGGCGIIVGYNNTHPLGTVVGKSNTGTASIIFGNSNAIGGSGPTNNSVIAIGNGMTETSGNAKMPHTFMFGSYATTGNKAGLSFRSNNLNHLLLGYDIMSASYSNTTGTNWIGIANGTAPSGAIDAFQQYSADITAGNAAPHFRTENGSVIKLYQQSAVTSSQGLADVLTNVGLLATGSSIAAAYERLSDFQSPYHYSGNATLGTSTSSTSWIINRIDFTTPGSPITLQGTGSWDNRTSLIYS